MTSNIKTWAIERLKSWFDKMESRASRDEQGGAELQTWELRQPSDIQMFMIKRQLDTWGSGENLTGVLSEFSCLWWWCWASLEDDFKERSDPGTSYWVLEMKRNQQGAWYYWNFSGINWNEVHAPGKTWRAVKQLRQLSTPRPCH